MHNEREMGIAEVHVSIIVLAKNLERCTLFSQPHDMLLFFHHLPINVLQSSRKAFAGSGQMVRAVFLPAATCKGIDTCWMDVHGKRRRYHYREQYSCEDIRLVSAIICWEFVVQILPLLP